MVVSRAEDIKVDNLASVQLTWRAIGFQDERKPELAEGAQAKVEDKNPTSNLTNKIGKRSINFPF